MRYEREGHGYRSRVDGGGLEDRPLTELLSELAENGRGLVRDEARLAAAELRAEAMKAGKGAGLMGAGGAVLHVALILLGATLVLVGSAFLQAWLSTLIVTALYGLVGWALFSSGRNEFRQAEPKRAIQNIQEDGRWAKETMRDIRFSRSANA